MSSQSKRLERYQKLFIESNKLEKKVIKLRLKMLKMELEWKSVRLLVFGYCRQQKRGEIYLALLIEKYWFWEEEA